MPNGVFRATLAGLLLGLAFVVGACNPPTPSTPPATPTPLPVPTGTLEINSGDAFSSSLTLRLEANITDLAIASGRYQISFDGDGYTPAAPAVWDEDAPLSVSAPASATSGPVTVRLRYASSAGTVELADDIVLDLDAPEANLMITTADGVVTDPALTLALSASDAGGSDLAEMRFSADAGTSWTAWEPYSTAKQLELGARALWGEVIVLAEVRDGASNVTAISASAQYASAERASMALKTTYDFDASLDYGKGRVGAVETVTITNTSKGLLSHLDFAVPPKAFGEFSLGDVIVDGVKIKAKWSNNDNLSVPLGRNMRPGEVFTVVIAFTVTAKSDVSTSLRARVSKANGIMQVSQWFPIISDGHALRYPGDSQYTLAADSFRLDLKLDRDLVLAAPGTVSSPSALARIVDFDAARDFAFSVSPSYRRVHDTVGGVEVEVYYLPGTAGATALKNASASLATFTKDFGSYPYERFVVAQATRPGAGNEYPGIIFIGVNNLGSRTVVRHEVAHQWFYGLLGNDQLKAPWLDEAFAEWAGRGYAGAQYCSDKLVSSRITDFPDTPADRTSSSCGSYDQTVYFKGATLIAGVRDRMGDKAFFASMKDLLTDHRLGVITTKIVAENWLANASKSDRGSLETYLRRFLAW